MRRSKAFERLGSHWKTTDKDKKALLFHGKDSELEEVLDQLGSLGADRKKITSLAKSIDFGEQFEITV
jgi:predicted AlkP superfamily phosphohydrolase/phosphomutase